MTRDDLMREIPGLTVTDRTALLAWLDSEEHAFKCNAWSEGQPCCLDRLCEGGG